MELVMDVCYCHQNYALFFASASCMHVSYNTHVYKKKKDNVITS